MSKSSQKLQFLASFQDHCRTGKEVESLVQTYSQDNNIALYQTLLLCDNRKRTPLHFACRANHPPISLLLSWFPDSESRNAALKLKDKDGITCLMMAVQHPHADLEPLLRDNHNNCNKLALARSKAGATALHYAAGAGASSQAIELVWQGAKIAIQTFALQGGTPLHWACSSAKEIPWTIQTLLETCRADVNATNDSIPPPLTLALAVKNQVNACALLESSEIHVEVVRNETTLFHMAVEHDLPMALEKMLNKLQNKDFLQQQKDKQGRTVMDVAMQRGNEACLVLLEAYGVNCRREDENVKDKLNASQQPNQSDMVHADNPKLPDSESVDYILALPAVSVDIEETALTFKSRGNDHFQRKEWQEAQACYTKAIATNPKDATFYANRSACHVQLGNKEAALRDATLAVGLRPEWTKAHYRKVVALLALGRHHDAALAAYQGLKLEPSNSELQKLLRTCISDGRRAFREAKKKKNET